ncbi:MAG: MBL fold metallo-hydrolase [Burkholderiaceae bacterium]|nr:MBL fold metallo-hydrolase [Burkholderiaceae bacterium]
MNAHLVLGNDGAILVDAGLPDTRDVVEQALRGRNLAWSDIKLIVVAHAHIDRAGNAGRIRELPGAPACGHQGDLDHYMQHKQMAEQHEREQQPDQRGERELPSQSGLDEQHRQMDGCYYREGRGRQAPAAVSRKTSDTALVAPRATSQT